MRITGAILFIVFLVITSPVLAIDFPQPRDKYVNDFADIFSSPDEAYLRALFNEVELNTTAQIVVVTVNTIEDYALSQYATELGQKWGVGIADKDNGLIILYVADQKKIFAATGYGLEGILPDSKVGRLLDENYVPSRDSDNFSDGIIKFSDAVAYEIEQNKGEVISGQNNLAQTELLGKFLAILFLVIVIGVLFYFVSKRDKKKGFGDFWVFFFVDFLFKMVLLSILLGGRGRNRSSGGFGGGMGGGFGGGGFGGGGAGR